jgi:hypothetical protein
MSVSPEQGIVNLPSPQSTDKPRSVVEGSSGLYRLNRSFA